VEIVSVEPSNLATWVRWIGIAAFVLPGLMLCGMLWVDSRAGITSPRALLGRVLTALGRQVYNSVSRHGIVTCVLIVGLAVVASTPWGWYSVLYLQLAGVAYGSLRVRRATTTVMRALLAASLAAHVLLSGVYWTMRGSATAAAWHAMLTVGLAVYGAAAFLLHWDGLRRKSHNEATTLLACGLVGAFLALEPASVAEAWLRALMLGACAGLCAGPSIQSSGRVAPEGLLLAGVYGGFTAGVLPLLGGKELPGPGLLLSGSAAAGVAMLDCAASHECLARGGKAGASARDRLSSRAGRRSRRAERVEYPG
jgi:hypothetical protein